MEKKWTNKLNEHEYACNNNKYIYNIEWSTFEWKKMGKIANNCKLFTMKMNKQTNRRTARNQTKKRKKMWKETKQEEKSLSCLAVQMWWACVWVWVRAVCVYWTVCSVAAPTIQNHRNNQRKHTALNDLCFCVFRFGFGFLWMRNCILWELRTIFAIALYRRDS